MPIEFAPPSPNVQPFNVTPPQYTDPLQTLAQMGQLRTQGLQQQSAQQELQANQLKNQQAQEDFADQQKMRKVYSDWLQSGNTKTDDLVKQAAGAGVGPRTLMPLQQQLLEHRTKLATANELDFKNTVSKQAQTTQALNAVASSPPDQRPAAWQTERQNLITNGYANPNEIPPDYPGDVAFEELRHHNRTSEQELALVKEQREATKGGLEATKLGQEVTAGEYRTAFQEAQTAPKDEKGLPTIQAWGKIRADHPNLNMPDIPGQLYMDSLELAGETDPLKRVDLAIRKRALNMTPQQWDQTVDQVAAPTGNTAGLNLRTKQLVRQAIGMGDVKRAQDAIKDASDQLGRTETGVRTAQATAPIKIDVAGQVAAATAGARADAAGLTDDDYNRAGEQYIRTGVMPAVGRDSLTRGRIVKAGNQFARDNGLSPSDVITMQAAYAGDKDSLKKFQAQRDQIVSFEQTAQKNLDLFLGLASKIPDTGVPWLNTPLRDLNEKMIGSENMAAVNAARQVANNEVAKVTSGGGLSGVLSDSARHEVESYNPKNATFAQTKAVANVVKQDMANRHGSMDATLSDIKARIGGGQGGGGGPKASSHKVGDSVMYQGKRHKITAIDPATGKLTLEQ